MIEWPAVEDRRGQDASLVEAARDGDPAAFPALFARWFDPCFDVAYRILRDREWAADVAQETFLAAWKGLGSLRDPASFGGWALRTARNRALNRLDHERRATPTSDEEAIVVQRREGGFSPDPADAIGREESGELVWAAAEALGERDTSVLDLHLRHGLDAPEIAEALGVTANNAHQVLFRLKGRLAGAIRGWVLWHHGEPACPTLARALDAADVRAFGAEAVKVIEHHVPDCDECGERQRLRLAPEALFAAVPIAVAGPALRSRVAQALELEGVPIASHGEVDSDGGNPGGGSGPGGDAAAVGGQEAAPRRVVSRATVGVAVLILLTLLVGSAQLLAGSDDGGAQEKVLSDKEAPVATSAPATTTTSPTVAAGATAEGPVITAPPPLGTSGAIAPSPDPGALPLGAEPVGTPPPPPPSPPVIQGFAAAVSGRGSPCSATSPVQRRISLSWGSTGGDSAALTGPGAPTGSLPPSGNVIACAPQGPAGSASYTLRVTGPGGATSATATA